MEKTTTADGLQALRVRDARHVLWFFGDVVLGEEPGSFTTALLTAISRADVGNRARLAEAFPRLVEMFSKAQHTDGGFEELRDLVKAAVA